MKPKFRSIPDAILRPCFEEFQRETQEWQVEPRLAMAGQYTVTPISLEKRRFLKDAGFQWEWHFGSMQEASGFVLQMSFHAGVLEYDKIRRSKL